jgi:hypothetical protein
MRIVLKKGEIPGWAAVEREALTYGAADWGAAEDLLRAFDPGLWSSAAGGARPETGGRADQRGCAP